MTKNALSIALQKQGLNIEYFRHWSLQEIKERYLSHAKPLSKWTKNTILNILQKQGYRSKELQNLKLKELQKYLLRNICGSYYEINWTAVSMYTGRIPKLTASEHCLDLFFD